MKQIENLDHLPAELGVFDEKVDGLLVETILAAAAALVPHLSTNKNYFSIVAKISETK